MKGAGAKHGTISSSNIPRVTGSDSEASAREILRAAMATDDEGGVTEIVSLLKLTL